jgi:uncharacterized protein GlcG (DUF336 family)
MLSGIELSHANPRPLVAFGDGILLELDGAVVGAIGVSGGLPDQDHEVAAAGARAL